MRPPFFLFFMRKERTRRARTSEEAHAAPFPSNVTKTALCSLLLPSSKQSEMLCFEKEEQRNERAFATLGEGERYGACDDAFAAILMLACHRRFSVRCRYGIQHAVNASPVQAAQHRCVIPEGDEALGATLFSAQRAAGWCGVQVQSTVPLSDSGMRAQQPRVLAIAATSGAPLDSPFSSRGQGETSPCRLSLWNVRTISLSTKGKRNGS